MPFSTKMRPYTRTEIIRLDPNQNGVYGIFRGNSAGMLAHIDGDNSCIIQNTPDQWTASVISGDPTAREGELIREYDPICNKRIPQ